MPYTDSLTKVAVCTPSTGIIKATYVPSLLGMVLYYLQNPLNLPGTVQRFEPTSERREITYDITIGSLVGGSRDHMVDSALRDPEVTHVLFIDDDMGFEHDCLNIALLRREPIILANYRTKGPPWGFTAKGYDAEGKSYEIVTTEDKHDLEPCFLGGFGFALIERKVFEAIKRPRFLQCYVQEKEAYSTEDFPFYKACLDAGFQPYVDHMLSQRVIHVGDMAYTWEVVPESPKMVRIRQ